MDGFAFGIQSKAEVATESCEGKSAACFCQGQRISGMDTSTSHIVNEYQGAVVKPRGPRKAVDADHRISDHPKGSVEFNLMRTGGKGEQRDQ